MGKIKLEGKAQVTRGNFFARILCNLFRFPEEGNDVHLQVDCSHTEDSMYWNRKVMILVIGGYGNFGKRLAHALLENHDHDLIIAGRSKTKAQIFCKQLENIYKKAIEHLALDVNSPDLVSILKNLQVDIVVNASGPYQDQMGNNNYQVASACTETPCHYVDLADARNFVNGFSEALHNDALAARVMLVTGASTVPGLSAAVIDAYRPQFKKLTAINYGISPANKTERGYGTISSILSYTGKPISTLSNGEYKNVYGWQDLERFDFGFPLGKRWMSNCDIPDLDLLPQHYPDLETVRFKAGLEVTILHYGLWLLSGLSRIGLVKDWSKYTKLLIWLSEWFINWGTNNGGMFVRLQGVDLNNQAKEIEWQLIAENGLGANAPIISTELIISRIARKELIFGAMPCIGLFTLTDFFEIAARWNIYQKENTS